MRLWIACALALLLACSEDTSSSTGSGAGGDGGAGGGGVGGAGGDGGDGGGGAGGGVGGGGPCSDSAPCGGDAVCAYPQGSCDPGAEGICLTAYNCDGPPSGPLCLCDGTVLEGEHAECTAWEGSLPFDDPEGCATGTFACGDDGLACTRHVEVCVETVPGVPGPSSFECVAVSEIAGTCTHGIADCSCLDLSSYGCDGGAACDCAADADNQEYVTVALP